MGAVVTEPKTRSAEQAPGDDYAYDPRGIRLMVPHAKDCYLDAQGRQEFIVELRPWGYADKAGRRYKDGRGDVWHRFACNNTSCAGEAWVRYDVLWQLVAHGLARGGAR